jgi:hypothetical protein
MSGNYDGQPAYLRRGSTRERRVSRMYRDVAARTTRAECMVKVAMAGLLIPTTTAPRQHAHPKQVAI